MNPSQHPPLLLGPLTIPAPLLPLLTILSPLVIRPRDYPLRLGPFLALLHALFSISTFHSIYSTHGIPPTDTNITIPLLSYTALIIGEGIHRTSNFWNYIAVAVGWILICPSAPLSETLSQRTRGVIALGLGVFGLDTSGVSLGVGVSALGLVVRVVCEMWGDRMAGIGFPVVVVIGLGSVWVRCAVLRRVGRWIGDSGIGECARCMEGAVAQITFLGAALVVCSFNWSCFRWRYLWHVGPTRAPAWTGFSFFGGMFFLFPIYALVQFVERRRGREIGAARGNFRERQMGNCLVAIWCTNCAYVGFWVLSELLVALE